MVWRTVSRGCFTIDDMCDEIKKFINEDNNYEYKISIGSDSQRHKELHRYITAIVVHRVGKGAQYYYKIDEVNNINSLKQKIMQEALLTLQTVIDVENKLEDILLEKNIAIEPHVDVGYNGDTKKLISEVVGIFKGCGFCDEDIKIKPFSSTSSCVANKHSK
jgi:predicted RNase H-related nuclease YkuK (DUF458 family)